ncbi:MAG: alpha/beta hydrolase domain-containing protein [Acidimicrobiia bacterium]
MGKASKAWAVGGILVAVVAASACRGRTTTPSDAGRGSQVTGVVVDSQADIGTFDGVRFERLVGHVEGQVHRTENVAGLAEILGEADHHTYRSAFEVIRPVEGSDRQLMVVEVENRGSPIMLQLFNRFTIGFSGAPDETRYPAGVGDGFLFGGGRSYARVQWETGVSPGVPSSAQGVGEVIVRDFGRLLRAGRIGASPSPLGRYRTLVFTGTSVSAWFINTFLAEGFNAGPGGRRVYDGALVLAGSGNWLAINQLGNDGGAQQPYVRPNGRPRRASEILTRPASDPFVVDVVTYTEFYRMRAALSRDPDPPERTRQYEVPAPKAPVALFDEAFVFGRLGCNDQTVIPLNPLDYRPYLRALLIGLEGELGGTGRSLPPSTRFRLGPEPPPSRYFNDLPGGDVAVPELDGDGQPVGGVRFPEADLPLGRPEPPAVPPVITTTNVCGNFGGYQPFSAAELERRYGSSSAYEQRVQPLVDRLVGQGWLLPGDRQWVIDDLRRRFEAA